MSRESWPCLGVLGNGEPGPTSRKKFGISPSAGGKPEVNVVSAFGMGQCVSPEAFRAAVGETDVHATELTFHMTYVSLSARSPKHPENVDSYECRYGEVAPSTPVKLESAAKTLEQDSFAFSDIDFDGLPNRIDRAVTELGLEAGCCRTSTFESGMGRAARYVSVTVHVTGTRNDGSVEFDGKGNKVVHDVAPPAARRGARSTAQTSARPRCRSTRGRCSTLPNPPGSAPSTLSRSSIGPSASRTWSATRRSTSCAPLTPPRTVQSASSPTGASTGSSPRLALSSWIGALRAQSARRWTKPAPGQRLVTNATARVPVSPAACSLATRSRAGQARPRLRVRPGRSRHHRFEGLLDVHPQPDDDRGPIYQKGDA